MKAPDQNGFATLFRNAEQCASFWVETAKLDFSESLRDLMERRGVSKADLAKRLGVSKAYITKVFQGDANFTLESMVKLAHALDGRLHVHVGEKKADLRTFELIRTPPPRKEFRTIGSQKGRPHEPGNDCSDTLAA